MSEQDHKPQDSTQHHTSSMNKLTNPTGQASQLSIQPEQPIADDLYWPVHWKLQGQPWRTKREIDAKRKRYLANRLRTLPDIKQGVYPLKGEKLDRADVEWLLANHDAGSGPVDWGNENEGKREGLDLRGANLCDADLHGLPLTYLRGGLTNHEGYKVAQEHSARAVELVVGDFDFSRTALKAMELGRAGEAGAQLQGANLSGARLDGASLLWANLQGANLSKARLQNASLSGAQLQRANLSEARLERADLLGANLQGANLNGIRLEGASLRGAQLQGSDLECIQLQGVDLCEAQLQEADLSGADLSGANLMEAQLKKVNLDEAQLRGAYIGKADLEGANLRGAQLREADLSEAHLESTNFSEAQLQGANLRKVNLGDNQRTGPRLADVQWGDTNLTIINDWSQIIMLGDEQEARRWKMSEGRKTKQEREGEKKELLEKYRTAVRANRQLTSVLRDQGLNEEADHFAYRAQLLQRKVLWYQHEFGRWLFFMLLALLSGYGYRIWRILVAYGVVVSLFALTYFVIGMFYPPHLPLLQALLESITAFHGRVFLEQFNPNTPQIWFTAFEAIAGLIIEGVFIAMLIQRFFGK